MPLPETFQANRPDSLGEQVQAEQFRTGKNANEAANEIAVDETPVSQHPEWLQKESKAVEESRNKLATAKSARSHKLREFDRYVGIIGTRRDLVQDRESVSADLVACQNSAAALPTAFREWPGYQRYFEFQKTMIDRVSRALALRELAVHLPKSIEVLDQKIEAIDGEIARLERTYGFTKE